MIDGIIFFQKPADISSNNALQCIKRLINIKKIGFVGTLDPFATGVLPICVNNGTKVADLLQQCDKKYYVEAQIGSATDTGDSTGKIVEEYKQSIDLSYDEVLQVVNTFVGEQSQVPPMYSALKYKGQPLYKLARKGITLELKPRSVIIHSIKLVAITCDTISLEVICGKGTYIRSLIYDIGKKLGYGAHATKLVRLAASNIAIENCITLEQAKQNPELILSEKYFIDLGLVKDFTESIWLNDEDVLKLQQGKLIPFSNNVTKNNNLAVYAIGSEKFIGLAQIDEVTGNLKAQRLVSY